MNSQKEKAQGKPPVDKKPPVQEEKVKPVLSLKEITEALGTMENAEEAERIARKKALTAASRAQEQEDLAKAEESIARSAEAKAKYVKARAELLRNERLMEEELALKNEREAVAVTKAEEEAADQEALKSARDHEAAVKAKARSDAGEYEPLIGEQLGDVFLEKAALNIHSVGVILRIRPLDEAGGKAVGVPEHLFVPNVKPSNGILRRSVR